MKYDELVEVWQRYLTEEGAYHRSVFDVIGVLVVAVKQKLQMPDTGVLRLLPVTLSEPEQERTYAPPTATTFDDDGTARFRFQIVVRGQGSWTQKLFFFFDFKLIKTNGVWNVTPFEKAKTHVLSAPPSHAELESLCAEMFDAMTNDFVGTYEDRLGRSKRTLGFRIGD